MQAILDRLGEFTQLQCQVVTIARGTREGGLKWLEERKFPFPLLLDRDHALYRQLGLRRNLSESFNLPLFRKYAENHIINQDDRMAVLGEDLTVMGGDFIVDSTGKLVFAHCSKHQYDRSNVADMLQCLKEHS